MTRTRRRVRLLLGCLLLCFCPGCKNDDVDRLGRIWDRVGERLGKLTVGLRQRLSRGWCALEKQSKSPAVLCERVASRLSTDKALASLTIQIEVKETTIILKGNVTDAAARRRAVELAETTLGVEKVEDELGPKE